MKYVKMLSLLAVAAAALMALAGTASATITSPPDTVYNGNLTAESSNTELDTEAGLVKCAESSVHGSVNNGATTGAVATLIFAKCGNDTVTVLNPGWLKIHTNGEVTSEGAEITITLHRVIPPFNIPVTTHCIYKTGSGTKLGSLTEKVEPAIMHIESSSIPDSPTDGGCSSATWTGAYKVTIPSKAIDVD